MDQSQQNHQHKMEHVAPPEKGKAHDQHTLHNEPVGPHTADFFKRFWICLSLTVPVLILTH